MKKKLMFGMTVLFMIIAVIFIGCPEEPSSSPSPSPSAPYDPRNPVVESDNTTDATLEGDDLTLKATVGDETAVTGYQWYRRKSDQTTGTAIEGATGKEYDAPTTHEFNGTYFYWVVVTFSDGTTRKSSEFRVTVKLSEGVNALIPNITEQPARETKYATEDEAVPLKVEASVTDGGTLTYQWYRNSSDSTADGTVIPDAKSKSYTPSTATANTTYYYVVITNTITDNGDTGEKARSRKSDTAKVIVEQGAQAPRITTQPESWVGSWSSQKTRTLTVAASVTDGGSLTYQWYKKLEDSNIAGEKIEGATGTTYAADVSINGTLFYYYCEVTNTVIINGKESKKSTSSNPAYIGVGITIVRLTFTGNPVVQTKIYDGTKDATIAGTPVLTPALNSAHDVSFIKGEAEFVSANVGSGIAVKLIGWYLAGTDRNKYVLELPTNLTGTITKAAGSSVAVPAIDNTIALNPTSYKITVRTVVLTNPTTQQSVQYAKDTTSNKDAASLTWQDSPIFTGLTLGTGYYIYARAKESDNYQAGAANVSESAITTVKGSDVSTPAVLGESTDSSITVGEVTLTRPTGQSIEYGISRTTNEVGISAWQSGRTFNNLDGGTNYYVFARSKANADWSVGESKRSSGILTASPIVKFNLDGGKTDTGDTSIDDREIDKGQRIAQSSIPSLTKNRYEFDWWYKDEDYRIPYNFDDPVNASFTLYAKWIATSEKNAEALKSFVYVPGGWYKMGTTDATVTNAAQHDVGISGFWMGKYEVTQAEWQAIMGSNPSLNKAAVAGESETPGKLPVEQVSWYAALVYCNRLSIRDGYLPAYLIKTQDYPDGTYYPDQWGAIPTVKTANWDEVEIIEGSDGYRLPTEAQWEYACRAGTTTNYSTGDTITTDTGWYNGQSHQVGLKPSNSANGNQWGLYDMHGNVAEWCWDWYSDVYNVSNRINPQGPSSGQVFNKSTTTGNAHVNTVDASTFRVWRGGSSGASLTGPLINTEGKSTNLAWFMWTPYNAMPLMQSAARGVTLLLNGTIINVRDNSAYCPVYPYGSYSWVGLRVVRP